jgi:hypothetical protein
LKRKPLGDGHKVGACEHGYMLGVDCKVCTKKGEGAK